MSCDGVERAGGNYLSPCSLSGHLRARLGKVIAAGRIDERATDGQGGSEVKRAGGKGREGHGVAWPPPDCSGAMAFSLWWVSMVNDGRQLVCGCCRQVFVQGKKKSGCELYFITPLCICYLLFLLFLRPDRHVPFGLVSISRLLFFFFSSFVLS